MGEHPVLRRRLQRLHVLGGQQEAAAGAPPGPAPQERSEYRGLLPPPARGSDRDRTVGCIVLSRESMDVRPVRRTVAIHRSNGVIDAAGVNVNPETEAERGGKIAQKGRNMAIVGSTKGPRD
jgi:hypothetical protein